MVYIASWDDFVEKSVQLYRSDPEKTRYAMKYRHCDGKLVLKVTDDKVGYFGILLQIAALVYSSFHKAASYYFRNVFFATQHPTQHQQPVAFKEPLSFEI